MAREILIVSSKWINRNHVFPSWTLSHGDVKEKRRKTPLILSQIKGCCFAWTTDLHFAKGIPLSSQSKELSHITETCPFYFILQKQLYQIHIIKDIPPFLALCQLGTSLLGYWPNKYLKALMINGHHSRKVKLLAWWCQIVRWALGRIPQEEGSYSKSDRYVDGLAASKPDLFHLPWGWDYLYISQRA